MSKRVFVCKVKSGNTVKEYLIGFKGNIFNENNYDFTINSKDINITYYKGTDVNVKIFGADNKKYLIETNR